MKFCLDHSNFSTLPRSSLPPLFDPNSSSEIPPPISTTTKKEESKEAVKVVKRRSLLRRGKKEHNLNLRKGSISCPTGFIHLSGTTLTEINTVPLHSVPPINRRVSTAAPSKRVNPPPITESLLQKVKTGIVKDSARGTAGVLSPVIPISSKPLAISKLFEPVERRDLVIEAQEGTEQELGGKEGGGEGGEESETAKDRWNSALEEVERALR